MSSPPSSSANNESRRFDLSSYMSAENSAGWGPSTSGLPQHLLGLPFMPFNKSERLYKIADWTYYSQRAAQRFGSAGQQSHAVEEEDLREELETDEHGSTINGGAFSLVDNKPKQKPKYGGFKPYNRRPYPQNQSQRPGSNQAQSNQSNTQNRSNTNTQQNKQPIQQQQQNPSSQQQSSSAKQVSGSAPSWGALARSGASQPLNSANPVIKSAAQRMQQNTSKSQAASQQRQNPRRYNQTFEQKEAKEASVNVSEQWKLTKDFELNELSGITFEPVSVEDLKFAGSVHSLNPAFTRVVPKNPVNLQRFENRQFFAASTTEDPILSEMIKSQHATVFATDTILSTLMAATRSVNSWDILVKKTKEGNLIFDKRFNSKIDYLSVNENYNDSLTTDKDSINHPSNLTVEATVINHNFSQQILSSSSEFKFDTENPFLDSLNSGNEPANVGYRYRKWDLGNSVSLIARTSLNGYSEKKSGSDSESDKNYIIARALNEFDSKLNNSVDWRQKLESQTGAVLASEMKNNNYKLARWSAEASLSGADEFRLGFVSRALPKNSFKHQILMNKSYTVAGFASSVNINIKTLWGSLKILIEKCLALPEGNYLILRDPAKPVLHVYAVPENAFENEAEEANQTEQEQQ